LRVAFFLRSHGEAPEIVALSECRRSGRRNDAHSQEICTFIGNEGEGP
jgi:hypothetical protein